MYAAPFSWSFLAHLHDQVKPVFLDISTSSAGVSEVYHQHQCGFWFRVDFKIHKNIQLFPFLMSLEAACVFWSHLCHQLQAGVWLKLISKSTAMFKLQLLTITASAATNLFVFGCSQLTSIISFSHGFWACSSTSFIVTLLWLAVQAAHSCIGSVSSNLLSWHSQLTSYNWIFLIVVGFKSHSFVHSVANCYSIGETPTTHFLGIFSSLQLLISDKISGLNHQLIPGILDMSHVSSEFYGLGLLLKSKVISIPH